MKKLIAIPSGVRLTAAITNNVTETQWMNKDIPRKNYKANTGANTVNALAHATERGKLK